MKKCGLHCEITEKLTEGGTDGRRDGRTDMLIAIPLRLFSRGVKNLTSDFKIYVQYLEEFLSSHEDHKLMKTIIWRISYIVIKTPGNHHYHHHSRQKWIQY